MFTGLIREFGEVSAYQNKTLCVKASHPAKLGDSIAINGACLTVVKVMGDGFCVELSEESESVIATENLNGKVHIEPAMQLSDRVEGHLVQGHVDAIGVLEGIEKKSGSTDFFIQVPEETLGLIVPKGSVAVDGVSLTVNDVLKETFRLTIIPHTFDNTLFGGYKVGRRLNIETDILARTIRHFMQKPQAKNWDTIDKFMALY